MALVFILLISSGSTDTGNKLVERQLMLLLERTEKTYELQREMSSRLAALEKEQKSRDISVANFYKNLWEPLTNRVNGNSDKIEEINKMISKQTAELAMIGAVGSVLVSVLASLMTSLIQRKTARRRPQK